MRTASFFPRNQRGGVLFRLYTGSAVHFPSFCCQPSPILPSPPRIDSSRRETANGALKPGIGLHLGNPISRSSSLGTPPTTQKSHPAPLVVGKFGCVSTRPGRTDCTFAPSDRFSASRHRQRYPQTHDPWGFRGIGHPALNWPFNRGRPASLQVNVTLGWF